MLVIEFDGGYHHQSTDMDLRRQFDLEARGWKVLRFTDKEVEQDCESVCLAIATQLGLEYSLTKRTKTGSGLKTSDDPPQLRSGGWRREFIREQKA